MSLHPELKNSLGIKDLSTREVIDYLLLLIQNIVAGTVTISENILEENCLELKILLNASSLKIILQYSVDSLVTERVQLKSFDHFEEPCENLNKYTDITDSLCKDFGKITNGPNSLDEVKPRKLTIFNVPDQNQQWNQEICSSNQEMFISFIKLNDKQEFNNDSQNKICQILNLIFRVAFVPAFLQIPFMAWFPATVAAATPVSALSEHSDMTMLLSGNVKQNFDDNGSLTLQKNMKIQDRLICEETITISDVYSCSDCGKSFAKNFHKEYTDCGKHFNQLSDLGEQKICLNENSYFSKSCGKIVTKPGRNRECSQDDSPQHKRHNKNYNVQQGQNETEEEREISLENQRKVQSRLMQNESEEKRIQRLSQMHMYRSRKLAGESKEQREQRLIQARINQARRLASETAEQREWRLTQARINQTRRLANETPEQRERRLTQARINQARRLANETEEQRVRRLTQARINQSRRLANESPEQRERRLTIARINQSRRLSSESEEQRAKRLFQVRTYQAKRFARESKE